MDQQVICDKCKCDNKFGAIFCRNCGTKLKVQNPDHPIHKRRNNFMKRLRTLLLWCITAVLIVGVILILSYPSEYEVMTLTGEISDNNAVMQSNDLERALNNKRDVRLKMPVEKANTLLNYLMRRGQALPGCGGGTVKVEAARTRTVEKTTLDVSVPYRKDGMLHGVGLTSHAKERLSGIVFFYKVAGFIPVRLQVEKTDVEDGDDRYGLRIGRIRIPCGEDHAKKIIATLCGGDERLAQIHKLVRDPELAPEGELVLKISPDGLEKKKNDAKVDKK